MSAFKLLSPKIQRYIYDIGWGELKPIQEASIKYICQTEDNFILSAATASGKTEAAFLPILSICYPNGCSHESGVKILYISPLIALINDQFERVEEMCKHLEIKITKWHGEANRSDKVKLIKNPEGVVLITPESIEALFCNKLQDLKQMMSDVDFVVVDEIHSFLGTERGVHLQSLLYRLQSINSTPIRFIGLSATLSKLSHQHVKKFFGKESKTKILRDLNRNEVDVNFKFFKHGNVEMSTELLNDLYIENQNTKSLVFPNSRARVEEIAVKLKRITKENNGYHKYFAHHSSVEKGDREWTENFAKTNRSDYFSIVCTSTLELGIDIGSIDKVIQVGGILSVSSLAQRLGRSGRKSKISKLVVYSLDPWQLLQNIACYELLKNGFLEPVDSVNRYDILAHQILSILKSTSGISREDLVRVLVDNWAFKEFFLNTINEVIDNLIKLKMIEDLTNELILGIESQYIVTNRGFYSVFDSSKGFKVEYTGKVIGELDPPGFGKPEDYIGENVFLAARIWKIADVDIRKRKYYVKSANDGKPPIYLDNGGRKVHSEIKQKMLDILLSQEKFSYLDTLSSSELENLRKQFALFKKRNSTNFRPVIIKFGNSEIYTFMGTKIRSTLENIIICERPYLTETMSRTNVSVKLPFSEIEVKKLWQDIGMGYVFKKSLPDIIYQNNNCPEEFTKYSKYLPFNLRSSLFSSMFLDIEGFMSIVKDLNLYFIDLDESN